VGVTTGERNVANFLFNNSFLAVWGLGAAEGNRKAGDAVI
jgi:hypothetical protein